MQPQEPPSSPLGRAIAYLLNNEIALRRFLDDDAIPLDNGTVERYVRTALTRKNYLFAGSDQGGERAATIYTLLACCALAEADPVRYLGAVMARLADDPGLLPARWQLPGAT